MDRSYKILSPSGAVFFHPAQMSVCAIILLFSFSVVSAGLDKNLVAHYKMNDNDANSLVKDEKGFADGTLNNAGSCTVSGDLKPKAAGIYTLAGFHNTLPYYQMKNLIYGGYYSIWWNGVNAWYLGEKPNIEMWTHKAIDIKGEYSPVTTVGSKGTATVTVTPGAEYTSNFHANGKIEGALKFNEGFTYPQGIEYVDTGNSFKKIWSKNFTVNFWQKGPDYTNGTIMGLWDGKSHYDIAVAGLFLAWAADKGGNFSINHISDIPNDLKNQWTMFTNTVEQKGSNVIVKMYMNGKLYTSQVVKNIDLSKWGNYTGTGKVSLGALYTVDLLGPATINGFANCCLDNIMIFNRSLPPKEISWLYNNGSGRENVMSK